MCRLVRLSAWLALIAALPCHRTVAAQADNEHDAVRFDVPALAVACGLPGVTGLAPDERLIEITLPVTCSVAPEQREHFREFRFDIHWNRSVYPLVDYSPRTLMESPVEGVVAVERQSRRSLSAVVDSKGPLLQLQPAAHIEGELQSSETARYGEIPRHELLVASGTIQRGTGAFFRYHPSRQFSLEGGREVSLVWRVPWSWRGGLLRVVCEATGSRKLFAGLTEPVRAEAAFMVAVHLRDDGPARDVAAEYVRCEQNLRAVWREHLRFREVRPRTLLVRFPVGGPESGQLPVSWAGDLVQSPVDDAIRRDADRLPTAVRRAAEEFAAARWQLVALSRPETAGDGGASLFREPSADGWRQSAAQTRSPTSVVE